MTRGKVYGKHIKENLLHGNSEKGQNNYYTKRQIITEQFSRNTSDLNI